MKPEERMAMLKELVGFQGQSIDERKRAKALLRSLSQGRDKEIRIHKGDITTSFDKLKIDKRYLPAIGRSVLGSTRSGRRHKTPISTVDFFGPGMSVEDRPFKGGSGDAKSKALKYQLGSFFEEVPSNSRMKLSTSDGRRSNVYTRMTGGAFKFTPFFENAPQSGGEGSAYINKKGNFQPRIDGKFGKAVPNPADRLKKPLIDAATSATPLIRRLPALQNFLRFHGGPYVQGALAAFDLTNAVTDGGATKQLKKMIKNPKEFFNYEALPKLSTLTIR